MTSRYAAGILGAADGVTSIAGVIAGGAAAHVGHAALGVTALGGALAATVSMGGAELLSEDATDWRAVAAMGVGTLLGSALPALPLLFVGGPTAWLAVAAVALAVAFVVGFVKHRSGNRQLTSALALTLAVLVVGGLVGYGAGRFL